jgi:hypothetical protein
MFKYSLPIFVRRVAIEAFDPVQLNRPIGVDLRIPLHPAHLLEIGAVLTALSPDDVCMQLVILDEEEELVTVGLVLVIMVDGGGIPIEDSDVLPMEQDVVDDLAASCLVHPCRRLLPPAEGTRDGL